MYKMLSTGSGSKTLTMVILICGEIILHPHITDEKLGILGISDICPYHIKEELVNVSLKDRSPSFY